MTNVELLLVRQLRAEATPAPVEHGCVSGKFIDEHAEDFRHSLLQGEIGGDGSIRLWGVYLAGTNTPICHTGNGPTSEQNARFIEFCFNNMEAILTSLGRSDLQLTNAREFVRLRWRHLADCPEVGSHPGAVDLERCNCGLKVALADLATAK
jgi:hypothetical protein